MSIIQGRLIDAINAEKRRIAVLMIDEADRPINRNPNAKRRAISILQMNQLEVISACVNKKPLIVDIRFCPWASSNMVEPIVDNVLEFTKKEANAFKSEFNGVSLHDELQRQQIKVLVVMGYHVNACVVSTVGANKGLKGIDLGSDKGALQNGYHVMTCPQILHGSEITVEERNKSWDYTYDSLEFYMQT